MTYGPVLSAFKRSLPLLLLLALGAILAGCGGSSSSSSDVPEDAIAVVGDQDVSLAAFKTLMHQQELQYKQQKRPFPKAGTAGYKTVRDQISAYLIHGAEFREKADELGVKVSKSEIDTALKTFKQQQFGGDEKKYVAARNAQGLTEQDVRDNQELQLLTNKLFKKITASEQPSDADLQKYYKEHKSQYVTQDSRTVEHILVTKKALADKIYAQLKAGGNFAALAKKYSKDTGSASQGGKLTIQKGQTVPEFESTSFKLKTGELSKPVKTQFGWHIIEAVGPVTKASFVPFAKVKATIKQQLSSTKTNDAMNKWVEGVQKSFCAGKISYAKAYVPQVDPCKPAKTTSGATTGSTPPPTTTG